LFISLFFLFELVSPADIGRTGAADGNGTVSAPICRFTLLENNLKINSFILQREDRCQFQSDRKKTKFVVPSLLLFFYKEEKKKKAPEEPKCIKTKFTSATLMVAALGNTECRPRI
jgi:hypothetical protein